jgi:hypothetical protein
VFPPVFICIIRVIRGKTSFYSNLNVPSPRSGRRPVENNINKAYNHRRGEFSTLARTAQPASRLKA